MSQTAVKNCEKKDLPPGGRAGISTTVKPLDLNNLDAEKKSPSLAAVLGVGDDPRASSGPHSTAALSGDFSAPTRREKRCNVKPLEKAAQSLGEKAGRRIGEIADQYLQGKAGQDKEPPIKFPSGRTVREIAAQFTDEHGRSIWEQLERIEQQVERQAVESRALSLWACDILLASGHLVHDAEACLKDLREELIADLNAYAAEEAAVEAGLDPEIGEVLAGVVSRIEEVLEAWRPPQQRAILEAVVARQPQRDAEFQLEDAVEHERAGLLDSICNLPYQDQVEIFRKLRGAADELLTANAAR